MSTVQETHFHQTDAIQSWGRVLRSRHMARRPAWRDEVIGSVQEGSRHRNGVLAIGLGRSYGDSGLNPDGVVIVTTALDRLIAFDPHAKLVRAEAGISLGALLQFLIPLGFFLPVTPGTRHVTLGGAVANDVHGKNHHGAGSFGCWVRALGLVRSDGTEHELRESEDDSLFAATIGGLGLTGLITWVEFEVLPVGSSLVEVETIPFTNLSEFFAVSLESDRAWQYTVSWVDCFAKGGIGRGLFSRARHAPTGILEVAQPAKYLTVPGEAPSVALSRPVMQSFNALYFAAGRHKAKRKPSVRRESYLPFFYPLDAVQRWNLLYGRCGLYQYQSVVPPDVAVSATAEMLRQISAAGEGSFLAVLKTFGTRVSPGLLSFPREGTTLALDFPNRGASTLSLLARLDDVVREAGGRLYPAKDGRMPQDMFRRGFPRLAVFTPFVDPKFSSAFWRRMQA
jgi:FAD/FMN-containing dehydrogenase